MKKITFVCLSFLINSQIFAQEPQYRSVFGEFTTSYNIYDFQGFAIFTDSAYFVKDTLVNSIKYKKFDITRRSELFPTQNNRSLGMVLLRESEDHSKLYCLYPNENTEYLLMDLSLNLQDTFDLKSFASYIVDSIFYDDENIKHIILLKCDESDLFLPCAHRVEFIEGIGSSITFRVELWQGCLLCAYKDSKNVYKKKQCFYEWVDPRIGIDNILSAKNNLKIYPNPANESIVIDFGENFRDYQSVYLYDLLGKPCLHIPVTQEKQRIDIQSLPIGSYIIQITGKETLPVYKKIMKL